MKFDKKSTYGRMTAIGEKHMKHSTFEKAAKRNTQLVHPVKLTKARKNVLDMYRKWGYGAVEFYFWCRIPKQKAKSIVRRVLPKETRQKIKQLLHK